MIKYELIESHSHRARERERETEGEGEGEGEGERERVCQVLGDLPFQTLRRTKE